MLTRVLEEQPCPQREACFGSSGPGDGLSLRTRDLPPAEGQDFWTRHGDWVTPRDTGKVVCIWVAPPASVTSRALPPWSPPTVSPGVPGPCLPTPVLPEEAGAEGGRGHDSPPPQPPRCPPGIRVGEMGSDPRLGGSRVPGSELRPFPELSSETAPCCWPRRSGAQALIAEPQGLAGSPGSKAQRG